MVSDRITSAFFFYIMCIDFILPYICVYLRQIFEYNMITMMMRIIIINVIVMPFPFEFFSEDGGGGGEGSCLVCLFNKQREEGIFQMCMHR